MTVIQHAKIIAIYAGATTCAFAALPLLFGHGARFLGKDVTTIAAGVISFYPGIAFWEIAKVLGFAFLFFYTTTFAAYLVRLKLTRAWAKFLVCPGTVIFAFLFLQSASALEYPALFEGHLSASVRRFLYVMGDVVSPQMLRLVALAVLSLPALIWARLSLIPIVLIVVGLYWPSNALFRSVKNPPKPNRPHILLIAIDSMRHDRMRREDILPNIRALAADPKGVSFEDHHIGVPRTFPSWIEILEGRNAPRTGIRHMFPGFDLRNQERHSLAAALRDVGYETIVISDFAGDIFPRIKLGFNTVHAPKLNLGTLIRMSVDQGLPSFLPLLTAPRAQKWFSDLKESPVFGDPKHLTDQVISTILETENSTPLFLTVFYSTAHFPYASPYPYYRKFTAPSYSGSYLFQKNPELTGDVLDAEDIRQVRGLYDGALHSVDAQLSRVFESLRQRGMWDDTLIVVTADHGEDLYEDGMMQGHGEHLKGENVLRVPLIMKLPEGWPNPKVISHLSRSVDLAPTIASIVGLPHIDFDGFDFSPWLRADREDDPGLFAYAETGIWFSRGGSGFYQSNRLDYPGISGMLNFDQGSTGEIVLNPLFEEVVVAAKHRSLITKTHKLIYVPGMSRSEYQLYNRQTDPENRKNIAHEEREHMSAMTERFLKIVENLEGSRRVFVDGYLVRQ